MNGRIRCTVKSTIASAIALMVLVWAAPMVQAQAKAAFDLPAQPLADSLRAVGSQTNINLLFDPPLVAGRKAPALKAEVTADEALTRLLVGTGIKHEFLNETTIVLAKADAAGSKSSEGGASSSATSAEPGKDVPKEGQKSADSFRVAQVDQGTNSQSPPVRRDVLASQQSSTSAISEIIVTAQKRSERIQDVPVPVTVLDAGKLLETNQLRLQDYFSSVPGLNLTTDDFGASQLSIRGLSTGANTNPTVAVVVDDVPYGSSSALGSGQEAPDLDPSDLARVEVLRGPQGTLYGASSLGGLIKYVTVDPSTEGITGRVQAGTSTVYNGAQLGYNVRGAINVPLSDTFAIRGSAFTREDPGYIDNPILGLDGANKAEVYGGHLSSLWRPSTDFSLKLSALVQRTSIDGSQFVDISPGLGDLQQNDIRNTGWYRQTLQAYSAILTAKLGGGVELTSLSGYNVTTSANSYDFTFSFGPSTQFGYNGFGGFGVTGTPVVNSGATRKVTQEIRLSVPIAQHLEWVVGGFYDHEKSPSREDILASVPATGAVVGQWLDAYAPSTETEYAVFTDLTYHFTDRLDVQLGGRESENKQSFTQTQTGPYVPVFLGVPAPLIFPKLDSKDNAFTYLLTPRFNVSSDLMVYARLASGFRPGGTNGNSGGMVPSFYQPDKTSNYEIGVKGDAFDHVISFDASLYYIDWKKIQLNLIYPPTGGGYIGNGSRAKSEGVELSVESKPLSGLTIAGWVSFDDAVITENFPTTSSAVGVVGDRLPYGSRISGNLSIEQDFRLTNVVTGFVGGTESYIGNREGNFASIYSTPAVRQVYPGYAKADLRAGIKYDSWMVNLFANNIADKRAPLYGGLGSFNPSAFEYLQPRTVGVSLAKKFE
jgi:iron complex outermembrane receptor protein